MSAESEQSAPGRPGGAEGVGLISLVRVHADEVVERLRSVAGLGRVEAVFLEQCTQPQVESLKLSILLVDSSTVSASALAESLGLHGSVTAAGLTLKLVAYGLAEGDEETLLDFAALGAKGFVFSDATFTQLSETLLRVIEGQVRCPRRVALALLDYFAASARVRTTLDVLNDLTPRQRQAMLLRIAGNSNKQVAHRMGIEIGTVKREIHDAYRKLGVHQIDEVLQLLRNDTSQRRNTTQPRVDSDASDERTRSG